tara:strand:+ start:14 stop:283 length:270 start_codon:yes stop_codon:yes gene_type:complete
MIEAILICLVVILTYSTFNLMRKVESCEDAVLESEDEITKIRVKIRDTIETMRRIDSKGGFESEDEVGAVFDGLKEIVYGLENDNDQEA